MDDPERALTPRSLACALAARWRFDEPVLNDRWALHDVYALDDRRIIVELREGSGTLRVAVTPDAEGSRSLACAGGLALSWVSPGPHDAGLAACRVLAEGLRAGGRHRWRIPPSASWSIPEPLAPRAEEASLREDPDQALLADDARHYEQLFGGLPRAVRVHTADTRAPGISIAFARPRLALPPSGSLYEVPRSFARRRFHGYFARWGCTYVGDGFPRTVPTPTTFRRVAEEEGRRPPLVPRLQRGWRGSISPRSWLSAVLGGTLPVGVAPTWAAWAHRAIRRVSGVEDRSASGRLGSRGWSRQQLASIPIDVGMLAHDMSLHALGLHALSPESWEALTRVAHERLREQSWRSAVRIASFFEGDLTRAAWEVWGALEEPSEFVGAFGARVDELTRTLRGL